MDRGDDRGTSHAEGDGRLRTDGEVFHEILRRVEPEEPDYTENEREGEHNQGSGADDLH
jgi:hypothetical protein